jgi:MATE family multidrug resistance protein
VSSNNSRYTTELHHAPEGLIETNVGDYTRVTNFEDAKHVAIVESIKLWSIASPICFGILCNYAINTFTNIFVGHLGNLELTSVSISLSVISNFSFGFMVSFYYLLATFLSYLF